MAQIPVIWHVQMLVNLILILSSHKCTFCIWKGNSKYVFNKVRHKNKCVHAFSALIHCCASSVKPECTILMPKDGLRWCKLQVKLPQKCYFYKVNGTSQAAAVHLPQVENHWRKRANEIKYIILITNIMTCFP